MDMTKYTNIFIEESREHLQSLNEKLLCLEANQSGKGVLDEIFRSAHTLKGMSATMGFSKMAELTHQMENVLQKLRSGETEVDSKVVDVLFRCLDQLEKMVDDIVAGGEGDCLDAELINLLSTYITASPADDKKVVTESVPEATVTVKEKESKKVEVVDTEDNQSSVIETEVIEPEVIETEDNSPEENPAAENIDLNEYESNLLIEGGKKGFHTYHITINIRPSCIMKSARAYMIFKKLEPLGEVIKTIPSVQDIENEKFENSFEVIFLSAENAEIIRKAIVSMAEVDEPHIAQIEVQKVDDIKAKEPARKEESVKNQDVEIVCDEHKCEIVMPPKKIKMSPTLRVDIERLDSLMNLVGELVINKTRLEQINRQNPSPEMNEALEQTERLTSDLQNIVMKVRMVPIEQVFNRFPRMVRDLARDLNKDINFYITGNDTELDRTVIDEIGDPLVHLLRNSIDHGIEMPAERIRANKQSYGTVNLSARYEGNNVIIEVSDDGKGINPQLIHDKILEKKLLTEEETAQLTERELTEYIMNPGFSTATEITDVSGRGVGLDAVKNKIEALSGSIYIDSIPGKGSSFKIQLPLTLAIIQALVVVVGEEVYSIPLSYIAETTCITAEQIKMVQDQEVMLLREEVMPLIYMNEVYQVPGEPLESEEISVVIVKKGDKKAGLVVDALIGQQEIVIKSIGEILGDVPLIAGATILGNGEVSLIVDVNSLF